MRDGAGACSSPSLLMMVTVGGRFVACALRGAAVVAVAVPIAGCSAFGPFPNPPKYAPVAGPVLVSADGKVITGVGQWACGRRPVLAARSFPGAVTLRWVNPDTSCHAEVIGVAVARAVLPAPLEGRALVQAAARTAIPYFSEAGLARVTVVPRGFRLTGDLPLGAGAEPGDQRTYTSPGSTARLTVTQIATTRRVLASRSAPRRWRRLRIGGQPAALLIDQSGGRVVGRAITWIVGGYRFEVVIAAMGQHQVPLSTAQLAAVARGIIIKPGQYR